jgi:SAM-dependent methyltransferase
MGAGVADFSGDDAGAVPGVDTSRPHPARTYDYMIGGKNNFAADREAVDRSLAGYPALRTGPRENRAFLRRAVRYLAGEAGIRQFLDVGSGLPAAGNVHEIAQGVAPESRIVYVDNDPMVLAHARALLTSSPEGRTAYIDADLRDPAAILAAPATRDVLDFGQPVALMLVAVLHFVSDDDEAARIVAALLDALPPGSFLVASHATAEHNPASEATVARASRESGIPFRFRDSGDFARLAFADLDLVPPGVTLVSEWRRDDAGPLPPAIEVSCYGGVARKRL